jgi:hypothetical protein
MDAGAEHWTAAAAANPVTVVAALVFLAAPVLKAAPLSMSARVPPRALRIGGVVILIGSWLWQLNRFGLIG